MTKKNRLKGLEWKIERTCGTHQLAASVDSNMGHQVRHGADGKVICYQYLPQQEGFTDVVDNRGSLYGQIVYALFPEDEASTYIKDAPAGHFLKAQITAPRGLKHLPQIKEDKPFFVREMSNALFDLDANHSQGKTCYLPDFIEDIKRLMPDSVRVIPKSYLRLCHKH